MREINIASVIISKRKEKGLTQDGLAEYIGVTKASVSKWETAQSYPDITFLPQLATFFNISIDELIGYMSQMTKHDIKMTYQRLTLEFGKKPFEEVIDQCQIVIKKYYACFPLLLQMALLFINHHMLADTKSRQEEILRECALLCERIKVESDDVWVVKQANSFEALAYLFLKDPVMVLERLEGTIKPMIPDETTLATAYQMVGEQGKARSVLQASLYQHVLSILGIAPSYFQLVAETEPGFETSLKRFLSLSQIFEVDSLNPNVMAQIYYSAANVYAMHGNTEQALDMIERYTGICISLTFPLTLHGDTFFDAVEGWFDSFDLGNGAPRSERVIKESMLLGLVENPLFVTYKEDLRFKQCILKIKKYIGGK